MILSICVSTKKDSPIFLLVLGMLSMLVTYKTQIDISDARTFNELGRATTAITGIPYGFHHTFIPDEKEIN